MAVYNFVCGNFFFSEPLERDIQDRVRWLSACQATKYVYALGSNPFSALNQNAAWPLSSGHWEARV